MYVVVKIEQISKEKPSAWRLKTSEQIDLDVMYRYGFLVVDVDNENLLKHRISDNLSDSSMEWGQALSHLQEFLPEEMIDFSLIMKKENG